jgi:hypothetical protein
MQVTYRGLKLEQAYDVLFGNQVPNYWWVIHQGTNRTVITIHGQWPKAERITTELAGLRDWSAVDDWNEEEIERFAGQYLAEVEVPRFINDPSEWDDDVPYGDAIAS